MTVITDGPEPGAIDLGDDHWYTPVVNNGGEWVGITEWHHTSNGDWCAGWVPFSGGQPASRVGTTWDVASWEPLTLSPSLLCSCGSHGWVRDGRWVAA